jgi:23S rRNA (adenine2503-C2)-methyltransferase
MGVSDAPGTFLSLTREETEQRITELGGKPFHARIIRKEIFERGVLAYADMTSLSKPLRDRLEAELPLFAGREVDRVKSSDRTTKILIQFPDGATVETVHMPSFKKDKGATLCVSTQVGCPVACPFCASGKAGLVRNLAAHEIIEQYIAGAALGPLGRSVVMGIGEPLLNYQSLSRALEMVREDIGLGARKITVSTVGFPERLRKAAEAKPQFQLAISLHTADDAQRWELVPAMAGVPIEAVLEAGDHWFKTTGREVTYEYCLMGGCNDSEGHAQRLARRLSKRRCSVNLIPYNPIPGDSYQRPSPEGVEAFRATLEENGLVATVRWSRGLDTDAACGQLRVYKLGD